MDPDCQYPFGGRSRFAGVESRPSGLGILLQTLPDDQVEFAFFGDGVDFDKLAVVVRIELVLFAGLMDAEERLFAVEINAVGKDRRVESSGCGNPVVFTADVGQLEVVEMFGDLEHLLLFVARDLGFFGAGVGDFKHVFGRI